MNKGGGEDVMGWIGWVKNNLWSLTWKDGVTNAHHCVGRLNWQQLALVVLQVPVRWWKITQGVNVRCPNTATWFIILLEMTNATLFFLFFLLCSFWLWTLSFFWATRSWPWVQRSTFLLPSTSTPTSSTFSFTSWLSWAAPVNEPDLKREQEGDKECFPLLRNIANIPFSLWVCLISLNFFSHTHRFLSYHTHTRSFFFFFLKR